MTGSAAAVVDRDYRYLAEGVVACEALATQVDNDRARQILGQLAERGRGVLAVIDAEPGLHTYLEHLPYSRAVALLAEIIRQAYSLTRTALRNEATGFENPRRNNAELWEEAEALTGRADELGTTAVLHPPRLRLDTPAGSRAMSRRLIGTYQLDQAADLIDASLTTARRLGVLVRNVSPDPNRADHAGPVTE